MIKRDEYLKKLIGFKDKQLIDPDMGGLTT